MFSAAERQIYKCPVTGRDYDPLAVRRKLTLASKGTFNGIVSRLKSKDDLESTQALDEYITIGRKALDLEATVLDASVYDSLTAFTHYLRGKGQRVQNGPTFAPCTDCPQAG